MNDLDKRYKWPAVLFFLACGAAIVYFAVFLIRFSPPSQNTPQTAAAGKSGQVASRPGQYTLAKGRLESVGGLKLRYHGLCAGSILIDVTIVDLDPDYAYRHRISRRSAEKGFQLAGRAFTLLSAGSHRLRIADDS